LIVVINCHGKGNFGIILPHYIHIQLFFDFLGLRKKDAHFFFITSALLKAVLVLDDGTAQPDAGVTDVYAISSNKPVYHRLGFATEGATDLMVAAVWHPSTPCLFLAVFDDLINQAVLQGFLGSHKVVALGVALYHVQRLARALREDSVQLILHAQDVVGVNADIRSLPLGAAAGLVDHNFAVGQGKALAFRARGQQKGAHAGGHPQANGGNITLDILHGIINSHTIGNHAARAVNIQRDVLLRILSFQVEQLCHNYSGGSAVYFFIEKDNAVIQKPGENVVGPFPAACLFDYIGNQAHFHWDSFRKR